MKHMYIVGAPLVEKLRSSNIHLVLPHLYDVPNYVSAYVKLREQGDWLMQDNSIFELRTSVSDLMAYSDVIGANELVVPEVLRSSTDSIYAMNQFFDSLERRTYKPIIFAAVIQGKTFMELASHYRALSTDGRIHTICIAFNYEFDAFGETEERKKQDGWNRFSIIWRLVKEGIWNSKKQHHLLGLYNPAELAMYKRVFGNVVLSSIRSNDSSSCFWHSLYGMSFYMNCGYLFRKIEAEVDFTQDFTSPAQERLFIYNRSIIENFRNGVGGNSLWEKYREYAEGYELLL